MKRIKEEIKDKDNKNEEYSKEINLKKEKLKKKKEEIERKEKDYFEKYQVSLFKLIVGISKI